MNRSPFQSYFICATPRTGSTLLCAMLQASGVAGNPQSWFRREDLERYACEWGIAAAPGKDVAFADYLAAALKAGRSGNGLFAARIMWGTMDELTDGLRTLYPVAGDDAGALLGHAFGPAAFIYLKRGDIVAQAVSRLRAEQTDIWHVSGEEDVHDVSGEARYDFGRLHGYVAEAQDHNAAWQEWFSRNRIRPLNVVYEDLCADPAGVTEEILRFLAVDMPDRKVLEVSNRKMADETSRLWAARYRKEAGIPD